MGCFSPAFLHEGVGVAGVKALGFIKYLHIRIFG